jgi:hypothetical protein
MRRSSPNFGGTAAISVVVAACAASAGAHVALVPGHMREAPGVGVAFVVATGLLVAVAVALAIVPDSRAAARCAALLLAALIAAYAVSRTAGLPLLEPHREPLDSVGVATKLVEALGLAFALQLNRRVGDRRSPLMQEVTR